MTLEQFLKRTKNLPLDTPLITADNMDAIIVLCKNDDDGTYLIIVTDDEDAGQDDDENPQQLEGED